MEKSMFDTSVDVAALTDAEFLALVKQQNRINLAKGIEQGWWEEFDDKGPIKVHRISKSKFEDNKEFEID